MLLTDRASTLLFETKVEIRKNQLLIQVHPIIGKRKILPCKGLKGGGGAEWADSQ